MGKDRIIANLFTEAVDWWSLVQKKVLKISQSSQENTCARVFFKWSCRYRPATLLKTRLWYKYFLVNFAKFLRASLFMIHLRWMLLFSVIRQISQVWKKKSYSHLEREIFKNLILHSLIAVKFRVFSLKKWSFKGYVRCKTIPSQNVSSKASTG